MNKNGWLERGGCSQSRKKCENVRSHSPDPLQAGLDRTPSSPLRSPGSCAQVSWARWRFWGAWGPFKLLNMHDAYLHGGCMLNAHGSTNAFDLRCAVCRSWITEE